LIAFKTQTIKDFFLLVREQQAILFEYQDQPLSSEARNDEYPAPVIELISNPTLSATHKGLEVFQFL